MGRYHHSNTMLGSLDIKKRFNMQMAACPFCGNSNVHLITSYMPHVSCDNCGADGPMVAKASGFDQTELQTISINKWNRRP